MIDWLIVSERDDDRDDDNDDDDRDGHGVRVGFESE